jgi:hypothetical protein
VQWFSPLTEERHELFVNDFHQLLAGGDRSQSGAADRFLLHSLEKLTSQLKVDVSLEQNAPNFAEAFLEVALGQNTAAAQARERVSESVAELIEHGAKLFRCRTGLRLPVTGFR